MKKILILILVLFPLVSLFAQEQVGNKRSIKREQLEIKKIAFFSTEIGLTPDEATAFWPVYNTFHKAMKTFHLQTRTTLKAISELDNTPGYSSSEMEKLIKTFVINKEKEADLQKDYFNSLSKILPIGKVAKFIIAEEEFRIEMIRMWKKPHHAPKKQTDKE